VERRRSLKKMRHKNADRHGRKLASAGGRKKALAFYGNRNLRRDLDSLLLEGTEQHGVPRRKPGKGTYIAEGRWRGEEIRVGGYTKK